MTLPTDSNPKSTFGDSKPSVAYIPTPVLWEVGLSFLEGAKKYGAYNWRKNAVRASTYYDACRRHMDVWLEGEDNDPDSGINHLSKAIACLMLLRDADMHGMMIDNRPDGKVVPWMKQCQVKLDGMQEEKE